MGGSAGASASGEDVGVGSVGSTDSNVFVFSIFQSILRQGLKKNDIRLARNVSDVSVGAPYDTDIHDALANLHCLDRNIPTHTKYGVPVNFFTPEGAQTHNWGIVKVFDYVDYFITFYFYFYFIFSCFWFLIT